MVTNQFGSNQKSELEVWEVAVLSSPNLFVPKSMLLVNKNSLETGIVFHWKCNHLHGDR